MTTEQQQLGIAFTYGEENKWVVTIVG